MLNNVAILQPQGIIGCSPVYVKNWGFSGSKALLGQIGPVSRARVSDLVNNDVDGRPLSPSQRVPQLIRHLQLNMFIDDEKDEQFNSGTLLPQSLCRPSRLFNAGSWPRRRFCRHSLMGFSLMLSRRKSLSLMPCQQSDFSQNCYVLLLNSRNLSDCHC